MQTAQSNWPVTDGVAPGMRTTILSSSMVNVPSRHLALNGPKVAPSDFEMNHVGMPGSTDPGGCKSDCTSHENPPQMRCQSPPIHPGSTERETCSVAYMDILRSFSQAVGHLRKRVRHVFVTNVIQGWFTWNRCRRNLPSFGSGRAAPRPSLLWWFGGHDPRPGHPRGRLW